MMPGGRTVSGGVTMKPFWLQLGGFLLSTDATRMTNDTVSVSCSRNIKRQNPTVRLARWLLHLRATLTVSAVIHAPIEVADGQHAKSYSDRWGPKDQLPSSHENGTCLFEPVFKYRTFDSSTATAVTKVIPTPQADMCLVRIYCGCHSKLPTEKVVVHLLHLRGGHIRETEEMR